MRTLVPILLVAFGSMLGGLTRWGVGLWLSRLFGSAFPWGTLFINITGSLFLGWLLTMLNQHPLATASSWLTRGNLHLMISVGFTGSYTTFSTFEFETYELLQGRSLIAAAYIAASVFVGLLAVHFGAWLAQPR